MKVLIACEESQAVCIEGRKLGHEVYSCDIQECSGGHPEWHIQGNVIPLLNGNCALSMRIGEVLTMNKEYIEREAAIEAAKRAWAKMDKEEE